MNSMTNSKTSIAELIGETPEMMRACGDVLRAEFMLKSWLEFPEETHASRFIVTNILDCRELLESSRNHVQ